VSGLLVYFDEVRRSNLIRDKLQHGQYEPFSDTFSIDDWKLSRLSPALLSFSDSTIDYIALAAKGKRVATAKVRVEFREIVNLGSVSIDRIESRLNAHIRTQFVKTSRGTGRMLSNATWGALIEEVRKERPQLSGDLDRLMSLARYSEYRLRGTTANILLQERDALGTALDIFTGSNKLRTTVLGGWAPNEDLILRENALDFTATLSEKGKTPISFFQGIPKRFLQEESALQHDLFNWDGTSLHHELGTSVFTQGNRRLEVVYANRNALEHTLGVDLIYHNPEFALFALVQYKLMQKDGDQMVYRPDSQLADELARMDEIYTKYRRTTAIRSDGEYRLNDDGFMFKLVPNQGLSVASGELIKGMYLTREYMHFLLGPDGPRGPKGGPLISFSRAPRYLTTSQFCEGVNLGLIGTTGIQSNVIAEIIRQYYETGRAVIVARESKLN
jgi:hypothetical protein